MKRLERSAQAISCSEWWASNQRSGFLNLNQAWKLYQHSTKGLKPSSISVLIHCIYIFYEVFRLLLYKRPGSSLVNTQAGHNAFSLDDPLGRVL